MRSEVDPNELRAKRYYVTPRGKTLAKKILDILEGKDAKGPPKSVVALAGSRRG